MMDHYERGSVSVNEIESFGMNLLGNIRVIAVGILTNI